MMNVRKLLILNCCLGVVCIQTGCDINLGSWSQAKYERTVERQAPLADGSTLAAQTSHGFVTVTGADVTECTVVAEICGRAPSEEEAQELAEQVDIELEMVGDTLTVEADKPQAGRNRSISISYTITVPRQTNLECGSSYGAIEIDDIHGDVRGKTSSGSITAENIEGSVDLHTSYGSITCKDMSEGDIRLKSSSGTIKLTNASFGRCEAHTSYGAVVCKVLTGSSIKLHSDSGSIKVTTAVSDVSDLSTSYGRITGRQLTTPDLLAKSGSGDLDIVCSDSPAGMTADLVTSYGSIDFTAPPGFGGKVDLSTSYGSVKTERPITISGKVSKKELRGTVGQGTGKLHLETGSGSISLL